MLARLRLHTSAALVRKETTYRTMREATMVRLKCPRVNLLQTPNDSREQIDTTMYTSCGICRKALIGPPPGGQATGGNSAGKFQYCAKCNANMARCAIWCVLYPVAFMHECRITFNLFAATFLSMVSSSNVRVALMVDTKAVSEHIY